MIKLVSDTIDKKDIKDLCEWLSADEIPRLTKGELTKKFESEWAKKIGTKYSVFVNSGSSAILLMLYSLKIGQFLKNTKIVVPTLSWITDVSSAMQIGLEPILCDCNLKDLSVDVKHLEKIFIEENPSALLLVSVLGLVPDMKKIKKLCTKYKVILLEDVCESMGSSYENILLGNFGEMSCFSFYYGHHLSTIEGGMINTNNKELYNLLISLRSHGWDRDFDQEEQQKIRSKYQIDDFYGMYTFYYPGFNLRSTDLQAFIGLNQIKKLDKFKKKRESNFQIYKKEIKETELKIEVFENSFISNFAFPVVNKNKKEIVKELIELGVEVRPLIAGSLAQQPFWRKHNRTDKHNLPNAFIIHEKGFYLPNHQNLTKKEILSICKIVNKYTIR